MGLKSEKNNAKQLQAKFKKNQKKKAFNLKVVCDLTRREILMKHLVMVLLGHAKKLTKKIYFSINI